MMNDYTLTLRRFCQKSRKSLGVVTEVSPVKSSGKNVDLKYFNGKLCNGKKAIRLVSFESQLRCELVRAKETGNAI